MEHSKREINGGYSLRPFEPDHLKALNGSSNILGAFNLDELIKSYQRGPAFTAFYKNEIIAIAGITLVWPGLGEAWALFGKNPQRHKFFIHREALRHIEQIAKEKKLERIQGCAIKEHEAGKRWLEHLGFEYEGPMRKFWMGKDFVRYARIF